MTNEDLSKTHYMAKILCHIKKYKKHIAKKRLISPIIKVPLQSKCQEPVFKMAFHSQE